MSQRPFVHLRVRSPYSLLEGALRIGEIAELCRTHAMPAAALTDTNNLFGALEYRVHAVGPAGRAAAGGPGRPGRDAGPSGPERGGLRQSDGAVLVSVSRHPAG